MPSKVASGAAVAFLLLGAVMLANPLYVQSPEDKGSVLLDAERTSAAQGAAERTAEIRAVEDLPPVSKYATRRALDEGSYTVERGGSPLVFQLLGSEWRYLASEHETAVYRPTVTVRNDTSELRLERQSLRAVEDELGLTPPGKLNETDHPKEIAWLAHESDAVVTVESFHAEWETRLDAAVDNGSLTVENHNDAFVFAPLGVDVSFVVEDDEFHRAEVERREDVIALQFQREDAQVALEEANASVVSANELSPGTRRVVVDAIENDGTRAHRDEMNVSELDTLETSLIRHEGAYYVVQRGHADDFDLTPLFRLVLTALGIVSALVGGVLWWWSRR